LLVIGWGPD